MEVFGKISAFSRDAKLFACVDDSGALNIWDTETQQLKQKYVPNLHLISPITCLQWIEAGSQLQVKGGKKAKASTPQLVLGTNKGSLSLYSVTKNDIDRVFKGVGHSSAVTNLFYDDGDFVYSCGSDSKVIKWSLQESSQTSSFGVGKEKLSAVLVTDSQVVVAAKQIKILDLEGGKVVKTLNGHQSPVQVLRHIIYDGRNFCLSVSQFDRVVSLWSLDDDSVNPYGNFVTDDVIKNVSLQFFDEVLSLTAVLRNDSAHVFRLQFRKIKSKNLIKPRNTLRVATPKEDSLPIHASVCQDEKVLVAYGSSYCLRFERVEPDFNERETVITREDTKKYLVAQKEAAKHNTVVPIVERSGVEYLNPVSAGRKETQVADTPFQTRLESLNITKSLQSKNMINVLVQGLVSKDATILDLVFQETDEEAIAETLRRLPPQFIGNLVSHLSSMMQKRTVHVQNAAVWLKILLQVQTSQLMAFGEDRLRDAFSVCLGVCDHRIANLTPVSLLKGRMDVLAAQLKRNKTISNDVLDTSIALVYQDESDEDDEDLLGLERRNQDEEEWTESDSGLENGEQMEVSE